MYQTTVLIQAELRACDVVVSQMPAGIDLANRPWAGERSADSATRPLPGRGIRYRRTRGKIRIVRHNRRPTQVRLIVGNRLCCLRLSRKSGTHALADETGRSTTFVTTGGPRLIALRRRCDATLNPDPCPRFAYWNRQRFRSLRRPASGIARAASSARRQSVRIGRVVNRGRAPVLRLSSNAGMHAVAI